MEIPTMAIDLAVFYDNDGVIFDEALAHRLGLVPLDVDADLFEFCSGDINTTHPDPKCVLKFALNITADRDNYQVYSSDLIHIPLEGAPALETPPAPVHKKILLTKLAKGQCIKCLCFAIKGTGNQHAKWSPAACVSYKPQPIVRVQGKVSGKPAERLVKLCPGKVFDIEDGFLQANRPLQCTMCRECIRTDDEEEIHIELGLKKYSFDFHVESIGVYPVAALFAKAARLYASHCRQMIHEVENSWPSTMVENNDPSKEDYL
ncbi:DNA-directed RNA polymerases I and III subunit rpac1 [Diplonema papillatum]|nr:DNA-directed RNA polymerases I and III subunit rpac1 [Diplonema papillatum]